jgi:hypothetical protein
MTSHIRATVQAITATLLIASLVVPTLADDRQTARAQAIHRNVSDVLSGPDFAPLQHHNSAMEQLGKQITDGLAKVVEWLQKLFHFGSPYRIGGGSFLLWPLIAVLVAVLAYIAAYAISRRSARDSKRNGRKSAGVDLSDLESSDSRDSNEWLDAAARLAASSDYVKALRAVFVATLLRLDAAGIVAYEQFKTNGEYLRATRKVPGFYARFRTIVSAFDAGWYGGLPVSEAAYREGLEAYREADKMVADART